MLSAATCWHKLCSIQLDICSQVLFPATALECIVPAVWVALLCFCLGITAISSAYKQGMMCIVRHVRIKSGRQQQWQQMCSSSSNCSYDAMSRTQPGLMLQALEMSKEIPCYCLNTHLASSAPGPLVHHSAPTTPRATLAATPRPPSGNGIETIEPNVTIGNEC